MRDRAQPTAGFSSVRSKGRLLASVALVASLAGGFAAIWQSVRRESFEPPRDEIIALIVRSGRVAGRLVGGIVPAHKHPRGAQSLPGAPHSSELLLAIGSLEVGAEHRADSAADADLAIAALARGDADRALQLFALALNADTSSAELWSDAAAAYLTASRDFDRPELAVRALAAAGEALNLKPELREAQFNRALALEAMGLIDPALVAWRDYAAIPGDPWGVVALLHADALQQDALPWEKWPAVRQQLVEFADNANTSSAMGLTRLASFRHKIREWIELDLLVAWARALLANDSDRAERLLDRARFVAEMLQRVGGDDQPAQGIRAITSTHGTDRLKSLATAHLAVAEAIHLFDDGSVSAAAARFAGAAPALARAGSSYAAWNAVYQSVALYADRQLPRALGVLETELPNVSAGKFHYLQGRRAWLKGLIQLHQGRLSSALTHYNAALEHFEQAGERESEIAVSSLLGESLFSLGQRSDAWRHQIGAVRSSTAVTVARRRHLVLLTAGLMCLDEGAPRAALEFENAVIAGAVADGERPSSLLNAYLQRSRNRVRPAQLRWCSRRSSKGSRATVAHQRTRSTAPQRGGDPRGSSYRASGGGTGRSARRRNSSDQLFRTTRRGIVPSGLVPCPFAGSANHECSRRCRIRCPTRDCGVRAAAQFRQRVRLPRAALRGRLECL